MRRIVWLPLLLAALVGALPGADAPPGPMVGGLKNVRAAIVGPQGRVYLAVAGEDGKDGSVLVVENGKAVPFASGIGMPTGMATFAEVLYVADTSNIWRFDKTGKAKMHVGPEALPAKDRSLTSLVAAEQGVLYAGAVGDKEAGAALYRIDPKGKVSVVTDTKRVPDLQSPQSIAMDGSSFVLALDSATGKLLRVKVADGSATEVVGGLGPARGLAWDWFGRLYLGNAKTGVVSVIGRPGDKPEPVGEFKSVAALAMGPQSKSILVADGDAGTLTPVPVGVPSKPVDETPLPLEMAVAFPNLQWTDWKSEDNKGVPIPLRPIVLTHAGDGSNRVFVATQHGVIHSFANDQKADKTNVFLDIQDRVSYSDKQNEEGFLGLAFHPKYKENGEFFVFYTVKKPALTNVVSRFRVRKDDPNKADPASEEELLRFSKPFWNHDGGTICFGPDGYLYITHGDGGSANDPHNNGQNLGTLLGKVLRIDVDRKEGDRKYAIPKDNPFVGKEGARPEIWCYGLRNVWRMAFDSKTGKLWAGEVGQNLYEEINLLVAGGNYGWRLRESLHPFGADGAPTRQDLIDPIWEYHHDLGKSITGGHVYRGTRLPMLEGGYLYADYVSNKVWALWYDEAKGRVVANRPIKNAGVPALSFGEDESGDAYLLTTSTSGKGIYRFVPTR